MNPAAQTPEDLLARLVAFDTVSERSNMELIGFVRDYLAEHGVASDLVLNADGDKANLFATIGSGERGGIALSGHTDVVPVDGQAWTSDPFTLTERGDRLYGRGSADMKGFLAVLLAMVPHFIAAKLATPIHLVFSHDEETGCTGIRPLLDVLGKKLVRPRLAIIGEPTSMRVVDAHKSIQEYVTQVHGHEAHSAMIHQGANAILAAGELLGEIARIRDEMIALGDPSGRFDPPYTSVHVGWISGGTANNIVPRHCVVNWEVRGLPGLDDEAILKRITRFAADEVEPKLKAIAPDTGIDTKATIFVPRLAPDANSPAESLGLKLAGQNETFTVSYGTEAGLFQLAGVPAVVCGPGNIEQAHKPDEYIARDQLDACVQFMHRLIEVTD